MQMHLQKVISWKTFFLNYWYLLNKNLFQSLLNL
jgi:hypothetical protein